MIIRLMTDAELAVREEITRKAEALKTAGICPTCEDFRTGDVYPSSVNRTFYEDEIVLCILEQYPRNPGHSIVLVKQHYEDLTEIPATILGKICLVLQSTAKALKSELPAEKVYLCSMCDGKKNHLHFQLIPRLEGDAVIGSRLFVKKREYLLEPYDLVKRLRPQMKL